MPRKPKPFGWRHKSRVYHHMRFGDTLCKLGGAGHRMDERAAKPPPGRTLCVNCEDLANRVVEKPVTDPDAAYRVVVVGRADRRIRARGGERLSQDVLRGARVFTIGRLVDTGDTEEMLRPFMEADR